MWWMDQDQRSEEAALASISGVMNEAWNSIMHGSSQDEHFEGWELLQRRLAAFNLEEASSVRCKTSMGRRPNIIGSRMYPTPTQNAFARCCVRHTDEEVDELLNMLHDPTYNKEELYWKSAKQMKRFMTKAARKLGKLEVIEDTMSDREFTVCILFVYCLYTVH